MILEVNGINTYYETSHILFDVSLSIDSGEVVCLLGRNGAGKTTTLRSIMGLTPPKSGSIRFHGEEIMGKPPYRIAQKGMGYVPDNRLIFPDLTVRENLEVACKVPKNIKGEAWTVDRIYTLFPFLKRLDKRLGGYLSGGEQQMLTVGRTLMGNPDLLLLDEPVEGLAPLVVRDLGEQILKLKEMGETILFSEQNVKFAAMIAERAYVIDRGKIRYQGSIKDLNANEEIKKKYLMI
ncbi:MAG: ABC transporter ATP-binding protein [Thermodesulfobacteriota bacterium]